MDLLEFAPAFFPRVWGGHALREQLGLAAPADAPIGEAWLVSDHAMHDSMVTRGPHAGASLHALLESHEAALLGTLPRRTRGGRFPLMLKLLDCTDVLSVQVHPDDALSAFLEENDGGKTEMWYFLAVRQGAEIICGLEEGVDEARLDHAINGGHIEELLRRWTVGPGDAALVRAGTVHALGAGLLAAEIQQTSDVTYRLFDWNRVGTDGLPRALHLKQAMSCLSLETPFQGLAQPLAIEEGAARREVLAACEFFAAERVTLAGACVCPMAGRSFRLLLGMAGDVRVNAGASETSLSRGMALLVAGCQSAYTVTGNGAFLDYYVPEIAIDIVEPLIKAGHSNEAVRRFLAA